MGMPSAKQALILGKLLFQWVLFRFADEAKLLDFPDQLPLVINNSTRQATQKQTAYTHSYL